MRSSFHWIPYAAAFGINLLLQAPSFARTPDVFLLYQHGIQKSQELQ
jgi:hypothetical protein